MGYDIRPISEINTFDYSLCSGFVTSETVRKSLDNNFFIVEGETITNYSHSEILEIVNGPNWTEEILIKNL
jgi:hypothetical protein